MDKNKIKVYHGMGSFVDKNTISVNGEKNDKIFGDNIIIATGSNQTFSRNGA